MASHPQEHTGVLLVDDNSTIREALADLLEDAGLTVCGQAEDGDDALELAASERPALAVVDLSLGKGNGLKLVAGLRSLDIPVVVCSSHEEPQYVRKAFDAGARGYVAKREVASALVRTVRDVLEGWVMISPRAADDLPRGP